jgi:hypothetical protein
MSYLLPAACKKTKPNFAFYASWKKSKNKINTMEKQAIQPRTSYTTQKPF